MISKISIITEGTEDSVFFVTVHMYSRGYSPATGNNCFKFLSVMLGWAVHEKLIAENPCKKVKFLLLKDKKRELLGADEIKGLFGDRWETYWENTSIA